MKFSRDLKVVVGGSNANQFYIARSEVVNQILYGCSTVLATSPPLSPEGCRLPRFRGWTGTFQPQVTDVNRLPSSSLCHPLPLSATCTLCDALCLNVDSVVGHFELSSEWLRPLDKRILLNGH